jgi:Na+-driven multidrug efflux pump
MYLRTEETMKENTSLTRNDTMKRVYRKFLLLCAMGVFASTIGVVFDTVIAGNAISERAVSAISLANPVYLLSTMMFMIFSVGGGTVCSQMIGSGKKEMTPVIFSLALAVGVAISLVLAAVGIPLSSSIAGWMGASNPEMVQLTSTYIIGLLISMPLLVINNVIMSFIGIDGSPDIGFISTVVNAVFKIVSDIAFVSMGMGILGVSLSTGVGALMGFFVCLLHFKRKFCTLRFVKPFGQSGLLVRMVQTGLPNALGFLWMAVRGVLGNRVILGIGGEAAIAGISVPNNVSQMLMVIVMSFGYALNPIIGMFYGEKDKRAMSDSYRLATKWGLIATTIFAVLVFAFAGNFAPIFGIKDAAALEYAMMGDRFMAIMLFFTFFQYNLLYTFQSTQHTGLANFIVFSRSILYYIPLLYLFTGIFGVNGSWLTAMVAEFLAIASAFAYVYFKSKKNPFVPENLFLLPKSYDDMTVYADVSVRYTKSSMERFKAELVKRVEPEIVDKTITVVNNVIEHQPRETDKDSMDVFITREKGDGTIKIRYCGKPFDAGKGVEGADYRYSLGINTSVIKLLNTPFEPETAQQG